MQAKSVAVTDVWLLLHERLRAPGVSRGYNRTSLFPTSGCPFRHKRRFESVTQAVAGQHSPQPQIFITAATNSCSVSFPSCTRAVSLGRKRYCTASFGLRQKKSDSIRAAAICILAEHCIIITRGHRHVACCRSCRFLHKLKPKTRECERRLPLTVMHQRPTDRPISATIPSTTHQNSTKPSTEPRPPVHMAQQVNHNKSHVRMPPIEALRAPFVCTFVP